MLLDELMPEYEFNEVHRVLISAPPDRVLDAVKRVTPGEMPLVRLLFKVRSLPARFAGRQGLPTRGTESLYEQMLASGFVFLGEEPNLEVIAGVVGQPWRLVGGSAPTIRDAREFVAFEEPGYMKAALNFCVQPAGSGTRLSTETRVSTTDAASRRRFALYWRAIQPASAAIRRSWLRASKRRVERGAGIRAPA